MENRIVEISGKKARKGLYDPPRFPVDITPGCRVSLLDTSALLIIPAAGSERKPRRRDDPLPAALPAKRARPTAKRKPAAKKAQTPSAKAKAAKRPVAKKPRVAKPPRSTAAMDARLADPATAADEPPLLPVALAVTEPLPLVPPEPSVARPVTPLPRASSVTLYRKNNMFDTLGYWLRSQLAEINRLFRPRPRRVGNAPKVTDILAENAALRAEIARLRALQGG